MPDFTSVFTQERDHWQARAEAAEAEVERLRGALDRMVRRLKAGLPLDHEPFSALNRRNVIADIEGVLRGDQ
ncbi:MAG: hypothetical protein M3Y90_15560 [Actinomycetota bacterium]|nr:hypothetical protein [Actinomycetota bacterium]